MTTEGGKTLPDVPYDLITEAAKTHQSVLCKVRRTTPRGQWATVCPTITKPTLDLLTIEDWLRDLAGGGAYQIATFNPSNPSERVVQPFMANVEGPPRTANIHGAPAGAPVSPPTFQGGAEMRDFDRYHRDPPAWERPPDAVASEHARERTVELRARETRWNAERDRLEQKLEDLQRQLSEERRQSEQRMSQEAIRNLESRIADMGNRRQNFDMNGVAAVIAATVPLFTGLLSTGRDRASSASDAQFRLQEMHQQGINSLLSAITAHNANRPDMGAMLDRVVALIPAVAPIARAWFEERSPARTADLITNMSTANLETLGMLANFMQEALPDNSENPWVQVVQRGIGSLTEMMERATQAMSPPQRHAGAFSADAGGEDEPQQQPTSRGPTTPEEITQMIMQSPQLHPALKAAGWRKIFLALHKQAHPGQVAEEIADALDLLARDGKLPPFLADVFAVERPSRYLAALLYQLPIAQNPLYVSAVLDAFDIACAPAVVTPPPAQATRQRSNGSAQRVVDAPPDDEDADEEAPIGFSSETSNDA